MPEMLFCVHTTGHFEANNDFVGGQELSTFVLLISSLLASIVKQLKEQFMAKFNTSFQGNN